MNMNTIKGLIPTDTNDSFLYTKKITTKSKAVYFFLVLTTILTLALFPVIYVDVSIQASGIIQPEIARQTISAPFTGKLVYTVLKENRSVKSGDTLVVFDTSAQKAALEFYKTRLEFLNSEIADLERLITFDSIRISSPPRLESGTYKSEFAYFIQTIKGLQRNCKKYSNDYKKNLKLFNSKVITSEQFENFEFAYLQQINEFNCSIKKKVNEWWQNLQNAQKERLQLRSEIVRYEEEIASSVVTTKINGVIQQCADVPIGTMLYANQKLAELSPTTGLKVICSVNPSDIGHLRVGQSVKVQVDAFNYTEWGMLAGNVEEISTDILSSADQKIYYRVKCSINKDYLSLKNGYKATVKKGMTVNTRMLVTRRSLYNLLFDKASNWFNPYENK